MKKYSKHRLRAMLKQAQWSFLQKLRSKRKKKQRNRQLLGVNNAGQNKRQYRYMLRQRYPGYTIVEAPKRFSLTGNTEVSLAFISKIENCFMSGKKVFVNLKEVETIAHGSIVVLLSILVKFKTKKIDFNGNFPRNQRARRDLK